MRKTYDLLGVRLAILAGAVETGGRYDLIEGIFPSGAETPLHRHTRYQEQIYVLEGEFTVRAEGRAVVLRPGDTFIIPAGMPHSVAATGGGRSLSRGLTIASPSGFARFIELAGTPADGLAGPAAPPDFAILGRALAEVGDEILEPPGAERAGG
ncbi:cupin domain-containing protein [Singulisphaera sp. PoT]|uniref:cupin domain-containing protein n=1 Tax=Singulisphaera sp. PoT TaxID=3411797 RepID=UPI003BF4AB3C